MPHTKDFQYAKAFKPHSPCPTKQKGGHSLFEMYHGLKNKKFVMKKGGRRVSKNRKRSASKRRLSNKQRGGNRFPKNPPYMLSTAPHKPGVRNLVAPNSMMLYERAFQGPFPSRAGVNFELERPFPTNKLLVEPAPMLGGKKKKVVRKASKKVKRKVSKKVVRKASKKVVRKASKKVKRKVSKKVKRKVSKKIKRKVSKVKRKTMRGG
jgi:hypothetical protein